MRQIQAEVEPDKQGAVDGEFLPGFGNAGIIEVLLSGAGSAESAEQNTENARLTNPKNAGIINLAFAGVAHLVERDLAKVEVASSSLVARSKKNTPSDRMGYSLE